MKHDTNLQDSINNAIADKQLTEPEVQEETTEQEADPVEVAAPKKEDHPNFKALRSKAEQAERERDDYARRLQQYEQQQAQQDPEYKINPDDIVEGKHLSKYDKKIKQLEDQIRNYQQQSSELGAEARLKATYPDFDKVVNATSIEALREALSRYSRKLLAQILIYTPKRQAHINLLNSSALYQEDMFVGEKAKAQANAAKPRPLAGVSPQQGESPLSRANAFSEGLTDNLKSELHKEMIAAMKNR